ncbi:hypothetical protein HYN48_09560 [Flavobacterium magnum]|uniref:Uncharacterized protein n=1 Tax=Flavobacterium magnum TaxID=2162713 RepID=A0A2S0RGS6_9FLAO|nr:hypothetical protein [Flavobacterium magnum]AWA30311.1 hypothetical protein HYN48_09560 [Flavobacterium magnum]
MGMYKRRKIAIGNLKRLVKDPAKVLFIHYSASKTFDDDYGNISPIITSIVIKSLDGAIDTQFAIHFEADKADITIDQIHDSYRDLELRILKAFNNFARRHQDYIWVHWNMKNIHFGFEAIKHRYEKIFEDSADYFEIPSNQKKDLQVIIEGMYGDHFVNGPDQLRSLLECNSNNTTDPNYLRAEDEAKQFENKNFEVVIKSIDTKVEFLKKATQRLCDKKLVIVNKNYYAIFIDVVNHPLFTFSGWAIGLIGLILAMVTLS